MSTPRTFIVVFAAAMAGVCSAFSSAGVPAVGDVDCCAPTPGGDGVAPLGPADRDRPSRRDPFEVVRRRGSADPRVFGGATLLGIGEWQGEALALLADSASGRTALLRRGDPLEGGTIGRIDASAGTVSVVVPGPSPLRPHESFILRLSGDEPGPAVLDRETP